MTAPGVYQHEKDISDRVNSVDGIYAYIQIRARKGPVGCRWITSETELLNRYTPNSRVEVGYDLAYYSALQFLSTSKTLLVNRVVPEDCSMAGLCLTTTDVADLAGRPIDNMFPFAAGEALLFTSADPGRWGNDVGVQILTYDQNPRAVREPNAFLVQVFLKGNPNPVEQHVCSLDENHLDGNRVNIFVEEALLRSAYIRAILSPTVDPTVNPYPAALPEVSWLSGGDDGSTVTTGQMIMAAEAIINPDSYPLTLLLDGGFTVPAYQAELIRICEYRGDCVALLSMPYECQDKESYMTDMINYRDGLYEVQGQKFMVDSSYAALYAPHIKAYDKFNDRIFFASPEGYAASIISKTGTNEEIWVPPAGFRRGKIVALDVRRQFNRAQLGLLYEANINCFRFATGRGINLWGQKTLQTRASALDRLNVRLLLITIKPAIAKMLDDFVFEFNDDRTRSIIFAIITSYMEGIKARLGVEDYEVKIDDENNTDDDVNNYRMNVWLFIRPRKAIEYLHFTTIITRNGQSFSLAG